MEDDHDDNYASPRIHDFCRIDDQEGSNEAAKKTEPSINLPVLLFESPVAGRGKHRSSKDMQHSTAETPAKKEPTFDADDATPARTQGSHTTIPDHFRFPDAVPPELHANNHREFSSFVANGASDSSSFVGLAAPELPESRLRDSSSFVANGGSDSSSFVGLASSSSPSVSPVISPKNADAPQSPSTEQIVGQSPSWTPLSGANEPWGEERVANQVVGQTPSWTPGWQGEREPWGEERVAGKIVGQTPSWTPGRRGAQEPHEVGAGSSDDCPNVHSSCLRHFPDVHASRLWQPPEVHPSSLRHSSDMHASPLRRVSFDEQVEEIEEWGGKAEVLVELNCGERRADSSYCEERRVDSGCPESSPESGWAERPCSAVGGESDGVRDGAERSERSASGETLPPRDEKAKVQAVDFITYLRLSRYKSKIRKRYTIHTNEFTGLLVESRSAHNHILQLR